MRMATALLVGSTATALVRNPVVKTRAISATRSFSNFDVGELSNGSVRAPTAGDRRSFEERQLRHKATGVVGVPQTTLCRHGFPQATLWRPLGAHRPISGIVRLTCPHLVKAIDELEAEGAISRFNEKLGESEEWRAQLQSANDEHRRMRREMMSRGDVEVVKAHFDGNEHATSSFLNAGIAGMSPVKLDDVKCLHAQLGDYLVRDGGGVGGGGGGGVGDGDSSATVASIGKAVAEALQEQGTSLSGCDKCHEQCDWSKPETPDSWRYSAQKNKSGLRQKMLRRVKHRENIARASARAVAAAAAAAAAEQQDDGEGASSP